MDNCSALSWSYVNQDEEIEELRQYLLYTTELETTVLLVREEITKKEFQILQLQEVLNRTIKETNEARNQCEQLMLENLSLQQQLKLEAAAYSNSSEDESPELNKNDQIELRFDEVLQELSAGKALPEKGKLLQAVKAAGPLLKDLLLAGPLPQWQHPPPQLDLTEIPTITISSLLHDQDSFNSIDSCFTKKRVFEFSECLHDYSPNKYQENVEPL